MNRTDIYAAYKNWSAKPFPLPARAFFDNPTGNYDVYEDDTLVINRLNYLVVEILQTGPRVFSFYELNIFYKDRFEDLHLSGSVWRIDRAE